MTVYIVLQRGEELPDSAHATQELAQQRANELGGPEEVTVYPLEVNE